jgi:hypothetical protein
VTSVALYGTVAVTNTIALIPTVIPATVVALPIAGVIVTEAAPTCALGIHTMPRAIVAVSVHAIGLAPS